MRKASTQPGLVKHSRRGSLSPAAMVALVVVVCAVGMVLDRLWLQSAQAELLNAAESAALGAGRQLVGDDLLRTDSNPKRLIERSRQVALEVAAASKIAGKPVQLDGSATGDVRMGRLLKRPETGETVFIETDHSPTSVVVRAKHTRARLNPVATFFSGLTGPDGGDVTAQAEASVDNRIPGFEPLRGAPIPILPIAILKSTPEDSPLESWQTCIDQRGGSDSYGYDPATGKVIREPDGLPEITLRLPVNQEAPDEINAHLIIPLPTTTIKRFARQVRTGWNHDDLPRDKTQLRIDRGQCEFDTTQGLAGNVADALREVIGQCRIVLLYDEYEPSGPSGGVVRCSRFAAGRILSLRDREDAYEIVFQPGVLTTRSAILVDETTSRISPEKLANPYVYKLRLTQ